MKIEAGNNSFIMGKNVSLFTVAILMVFMCLNASEKERIDPMLYTRYTNEVTSTFIEEMHREYGLECGWSGGQMPYDIEKIRVGLFAYRTVSIKQARELEIKATERLVQIINAHPKIRPLLIEYPFPASRASVSIAFRKEKGVPYSNDNISFVCHAKNRLYYLAHDPQNPYVGKDIKDEPYEEALKIVQGSKR